MRVSLAQLLGWTACVLTTLFAWPQAIRALRSARDATGGISLGSVALMYQSGLLWTAYGVLVASPYITVANASVTAAAVAIGIACRARLRWPLVVLGGGGPLVVMALAALAGPSLTGIVGDVTAGFMTVPQVIVALRAGPTSTLLAAVSPATYVLLATNAACWIGYGIAIGDPLVVAPNCISLPAAVLILVRRQRLQRSQRLQGAPGSAQRKPPPM